VTRRRRIAIAAASIAAGLAVVLGVWRPWSKGAKSTMRYDSARVERGKIVAKVTATGTLSALVTVQVGSQVSGRVQALYADYNTPVKKGQLIAKIDPQLFQAAVEQARANHVAAQGNLAKAKAQATDAARQRDRAKALVDRKLIAQADYDTAQSNADAAAGGEVEQARAALHQAEVNLAYTSIISPTSGVVISRSVDVGQTVAASLQAPTLFVIAEDLAKMQVDTSVAEADVGRLSDKMDASFTVDAYPADVFRGVVRQIRNAPQTVQNVVTYDAVVDVANTDLRLRPGMTANVTFVYAQKDDVLRIPNAALRFRPPPEMLAAVGQGQNGGQAQGAQKQGQGGGQGQGGAQAQAGGQGPGGQAQRQGQGGGAPGGTDGGGKMAPVSKGVVPTGAGGPGAAAPGGAAPSGGAGKGNGQADTPDRRTVFVLRGDRAVPVRIKVGISDGSFTEVVDGDLQPGDEVVTDASGPPRGLPAALRRGL
jgi:HlyD family secretion protein